MKVTTQQVDGADALRAVADGKHVQMIWECDGEPHFSNFTTDILDKMTIGRAWLIVDIKDDDEPEEDPESEFVENDSMEVTWDDDFTEKIASSQQNIAENFETAAEEVEIQPEPKGEIITDQEIEKTGPITVKIPNSQKTMRAHWRKLDEAKLIDMKKRGMPEREIADLLDVTQPTVHNHVQKLRKEGKL